MLERLLVPLGVTIVNIVATADHCHAVAPGVPDPARVKSFDAIARRFGEAHDVVLRPPGGPASLDLSIAALRGAAGTGPARWLLLAQSEADRTAFVAPLARVVEEAAPPCRDHFGLTHLSANAAVDALAMLSWLLEAGERALLVLTDQPVLAGARAADSSVVLAVEHDRGPLRVLAIGHTSWPREAFATAAAFAEHLASDVAGMLDGNIATVVAQDLFGPVDHGSGDVWQRLQARLVRGEIAPGEQVLIAATSGVRRISYALLEVI